MWLFEAMFVQLSLLNDTFDTVTHSTPAVAAWVLHPRTVVQATTPSHINELRLVTGIRTSASSL